MFNNNVSREWIFLELGTRIGKCPVFAKGMYILCLASSHAPNIRKLEAGSHSLTQENPVPIFGSTAML